MIFSKKMKDLMRAYELEAQDVCFAQLVADGYSLQEACSVIYRPFGRSLATTASQILKQKPGIQVLIDNLKMDIDSMTDVLNGNDGKKKRKKSVTFDKDMIAQELYTQATRAKEGKERADIWVKIADLMQVKKEEDKDAEKRVLYYLPLRCDICPYKNNKKENE